MGSKASIPSAGLRYQRANHGISGDVGVKVRIRPIARPYDKCIMPNFLKPDPATPETVLTAVDRFFANKKQAAHACNVSTRTIDIWRRDGVIPWIRIRGVILFDLAEVRKALASRYTIHEAGPLYDPMSKGRPPRSKDTRPPQASQPRGLKG